MNTTEFEKVKNEFLQEAQMLKDSFLEEVMDFRKRIDVFVNTWNRIQNRINVVNQIESDDKLNK